MVIKKEKYFIVNNSDNKNSFLSVVFSLYISRMNSPQLLNETELRAYWTWMGEDGIARSVVKPGAEINLDDAIANSMAVNALFQGVKFPLLVNSCKVKSMSREARKYLSVNDRSTHVTAFAVVVGSNLSKIIVNFFFQFNKASVPAKMFTDEREAIKWLENFKQKSSYEFQVQE